ncbi:hypothetical protein S7S_17545 [Isoalcanivorax pacificus W11-5]|uniref:DUF6868 domain-containing protein n=1 Tax=Isoalcanivorax pacificus W11-5 TaxID=391936 RepID=A0A0B4XRV0_9GAMM|nr:hypothetical protein [Isoalcanivorax pacificus]AJD49921.1 hypothetical protein S7S_17545 [Isoalcanivorax pacificus W11-5]
MSIAEFRDVLLWSTLINYLLLMIWFAAVVLARDAMYRLHTRWFDLSGATFDALHYGGMTLYKLGILLLNLAPLIALCIVGS